MDANGSAWDALADPTRRRIFEPPARRAALGRRARGRPARQPPGRLPAPARPRAGRPRQPPAERETERLPDRARGTGRAPHVLRPVLGATRSSASPRRPERSEDERRDNRCDSQDRARRLRARGGVRALHEPGLVVVAGVDALVRRRQGEGGRLRAAGRRLGLRGDRRGHGAVGTGARVGAAAALRAGVADRQVRRHGGGGPLLRPRGRARGSSSSIAGWDRIADPGERDGYAGGWEAVLAPYVERAKA